MVRTREAEDEDDVEKMMKAVEQAQSKPERLRNTGLRGVGGVPSVGNIVGSFNASFFDSEL